MATEWISRDCVFAALDMCAVLAHYDIRAGRGTSFRIHCPFHEDDRPSCSVNPDGKVFNCFGCGEQGNVLDFIASMEGLDPKAEFRAVLEKAIEIIGHNPTPQQSTSRHAAKSKSDQAEGSKSDKDRYCTDPKPWDADDAEKGASQNASPARKKAKRKSPTKPAVSQDADGSLDLEPNRVLGGPAFPLKLEQKHPWLDNQLKRIGVNRAVAAEMGIGFESRSNALMANRVCFPIHNAAGDLVAYAGRWASDDIDEQGRFFAENGREQPRYRLPKGFHKQLELYNWHRVREQFADEETIVLVEGFWSVLRLQALAIPSIALMGLSISDTQVRLLLEGGIRSVVVMLDGDDEGQMAANTLVSRLASDLFTRCIRLPDGTKPDDVDLSILRQVKALCAETRLKMDPIQPTIETPKPPAIAKVKNRVAKKPDAASSQKMPKKADSNTSPPRGFALPQSSATASFGWKDVG